jgi:hypothetical protein
MRLPIVDHVDKLKAYIDEIEKVTASYLGYSKSERHYLPDQNRCCHHRKEGKGIFWHQPEGHA